jgi:pilus assembly protein CpaB
MSRKAIIPLVLGLGIGLLAVKFVVQSIQKAQASSASHQIVTVVRAKEDIAAHEEITKEAVETVETADSLFAPQNDRIEQLDQAIGRVTAKVIAKNAPVLRSMLAPEGTKPGMVGRIPPGYRAVSVKIDEVTGVAYQIKQGDWVDVIVVMDIDTGNKGKKETIAEVILQHVQVAAIGYGASPEPEQAGGKVKPAKSATLLVPESDVPKLHLAGSRGKLTLAMRGEDDKLTDTPAKAVGSEIMANMSRMLEDLSQPPVEPPPVASTSEKSAQRRPPVVVEEPEPHAIMVFHGSTVGNQQTLVEQITFESNQSPHIVAIAAGAPTRASATMSGVKKGRPRASVPGSKEKEPAGPPSHEDAEGDSGEVVDE